jgi:hypothetical protein
MEYITKHEWQKTDLDNIQLITASAVTFRKWLLPLLLRVCSEKKCVRSSAKNVVPV